ncbi:MAG: serine protease [Isosphaeraceae bacterium]|nr:serine protease [Isosphaeraceae bacterium]
MSSTEWVWPSLCLAVGLILLIAEAFIPSGGLIGLLAVGFLALSLYLAFATSTALGLKFLFALGLLLPLTLALAIHLWPRTPLAKWIFLKPPDPEDIMPEERTPALDHLIGQFGRAMTPLRPSGLVDFDGRRLDAISEEGLIPAGTLVRAVQVRGGHLVVRKAQDRTLEEMWTQESS